MTCTSLVINRRLRAVAANLLTALLALLAPTSFAAVPSVPTTETRTSRFEYDPTTGLLVKEIVEPSSANLCVATVYTHDDFGNRKSATTRNCNGSAGEAAAPAAGSVALFTARTTTTTYDTRGQFPVTVTNALNQSETHEYDKRFGTPTSLRGPNQLTTTWQYDGFGRKTLEQRADGTSTTWTYLECSIVPSCPYRYAIRTITGGAPTVETYMDVFGRERTQIVTAFVVGKTPKWRSQQNFDAQGRVVTKTRRFPEGNAAAALAATTTIQYDLLNRVKTVTEPVAATGEAQPITRTDYDGLRTFVTDPRGYTKNIYRNAAGQQERVVDHRGGVVRYGYDAFGNLVGTDAHGVFTVVKYDLRGHKIEMNDPDMGIWRYENDALGQLKKQTNAKGQITTLAYDLLGRMTQRTEPDLTSTWEYDINRAECANANGKAMGKLSRAATTANYSRIHCYDSFSRASSERTTQGTETFVSSITYDSFSRVDVTTYPTGYQVRNTYQNGYLRQVVQVAGGTVLWQANSLSPNGELLTESLGNGIATTRTYDNLGRLRTVNAGSGNAVQSNTFGFDAVGNLTNRAWVIGGVTRSEAFTYDELNRLLNVAGTNGPPNKSQTYDAIGNLTTKTGVGTYQYHAGTHKLQLIQGTVNGITNPSFTHDPNGNLSNGAGYTNTWTSFDKPLSIQKTGGAITSSFTYGPEHQRIRQIAGAVTTLYFGAYERDTNSSGPVEHKHYITAGSALIALYTTRSSGPTNEMRYMHRDHLGSVVAVTDQAGVVVARYGYDAWGKRRNESTGADATITTAAFDRGYTGHEMLDSLQLVHMNGRVYDPLLGRFVSADPILQAPSDGQNYNRYSYVLNSPLRYVDPSGYKFQLRNWIGVVVAAVVTAVTYGATSEWLAAEALAAASASTTGAASTTVATAVVTEFGYATSLTFTGGAVAGAASGAAGGFAGAFIASNGDLRTSFQAAGYGAFGGALSGGISEHFGTEYGLDRVAAKAAAGGLRAAVTGGDIKKGFLQEFGWSALAYLNVQMRQAMIQNSLLDKRLDENGRQVNDGTGLSRGLFRDMFKLGGGRYTKDFPNNCSSLGCWQSGPGSVIGIDYSSGGVVDRIIEAFAGPHDLANSFWFYAPNGSINPNLSMTRELLGEVLGNYTTSLVFAAPFAAAAIRDDLGVAYSGPGRRQ